MTTTALIAGAASGLGAEFARLFAKDGYDVALVARSEDKLHTLACSRESRTNFSRSRCVFHRGEW